MSSTRETNSISDIIVSFVLRLINEVMRRLQDAAEGQEVTVVQENFSSRVIIIESREVRQLASRGNAVPTQRRVVYEDGDEEEDVSPFEKEEKGVTYNPRFKRRHHYKRFM